MYLSLLEGLYRSDPRIKETVSRLASQSQEYIMYLSDILPANGKYSYLFPPYSTYDVYIIGHLSS